MTAPGYNASTLGLSGLDLAFGKFPGSINFAGIGFADNIGTSDPPVDVGNQFQIDGENLFNLSTTADIDTLSSDNAGDANLIIVNGIDDDGLFTAEVITLNGLSKVTLVTPLRRVNRIVSISAANVLGVVRIYVNGDITLGVPDDLTKVRALINGAENISQQALFSTPSNFQTFLLNSFVNVGSVTGGVEKQADVQTRFTPAGSVSIQASQFTVANRGTGFININQPVPFEFAPLTDFCWRVTAVSSNNTRINAGFNFFLKALK